MGSKYTEKILVLAMIVLFAVSCSEGMIGDGGINLNIFPYLKFSLSEDRTGFEASVLKGAALEEVRVPGMYYTEFGAMPVSAFLGFEDSRDAGRLKRIILDAQVGLAEGALADAANLESIEMTGLQSDSSWKLPGPISLDDESHFCWKAGSEVIWPDMPMEPGNIEAKPVTEPHSIGWLHDDAFHWQGCFCGYAKTEKQAHQFVNDSVCEICGYVLDEDTEGSGGFVPEITDPRVYAHLESQMVAEKVYEISLVVDMDESSKYYPTDFIWYLNDILQEGERGTSFKFSAPMPMTYKIRCVFSNEEGGKGSDTLVIRSN